MKMTNMIKTHKVDSEISIILRMTKKTKVCLNYSYSYSDVFPDYQFEG